MKTKFEFFFLRLKDDVKKRVVDIMIKSSFRYESEWMKKRLPTGNHQVFSIVQQSDPYKALRNFVKENDISQE